MDIQIGDRVKYVGRYIPYYGRTGIVGAIYGEREETICRMTDDHADTWLSYCHNLKIISDDAIAPASTEVSDIDDFLSEYE